MPKQRRVVCSAIILNDGVMLIGPRHFDSTMHEQIENLYENNGREYPGDSGSVEGFIDQYGTFMSRVEAWSVADAAGQIIYRCGGDDSVLYSENLY